MEWGIIGADNIEGSEELTVEAVAALVDVGSGVEAALMEEPGGRSQGHERWLLGAALGVVRARRRFEVGYSDEVRAVYVKAPAQEAGSRHSALPF